MTKKPEDLYLNYQSGPAVPTKFNKIELLFMAELKKRTNLSRSEIIRRAVWLMYRESLKAKNVHQFLGEIGEDRALGEFAMSKKCKAKSSDSIDQDDPG